MLGPYSGGGRGWGGSVYGLGSLFEIHFPLNHGSIYGDSEYWDWDSGGVMTNLFLSIYWISCLL
jgi:hypothetical protein